MYSEDLTIENRKFQSDLDVQEGLYAIEQQIANIALTNASKAEKEQNIANLIEQQKLLQLQQAMANKLDIIKSLHFLPMHTKKIKLFKLIVLPIV